MLKGRESQENPSHKQKRREKQDYLSDHNELGKHHFLHASNGILHSCLVCAPTAGADLSILVAATHELSYGFAQYLLELKLRWKSASRMPTPPVLFLSTPRRIRNLTTLANITGVTLTNDFHQRIIYLVDHSFDWDKRVNYWV